MNEIVFPVVGAVLVFFAVVPLLTMAARSAVALLPATGDRVVAQESPWRFLIVIGPTLGPIIWLISASIHQSEEGTPLAACVVDHLGGDLCRDVVLFGFILLAILGYGVLWRACRESRVQSLEHVATREPVALSADRSAASGRVRSICQRNLALAGCVPRIRVVERGLAPACTRGLFRPRVEIETGLVMRLDEDELEATLLHELEHAHAWDPLRFFVANVALFINPLGALLSSELARYHFAREALCDRRAVQCGADPLALARSIVSVATPSARAPAAAPALGGHGIGAIRLRVQLLLGYAARWPGPVQRRPPVGVVTTLILLLAVSPHLMGAGPLDVFHQGIERAALLLGLG